MTSHATSHRATSARWVPFALVGLGLFPAVAGLLRLVEVFGGPHVMPAHPGIAASPLPVIVHIASVIPYAFLGAFQFSARLRRSGWHRVSGRVLGLLGLVVAFSGLWMTLFYPRHADTGELLYLFRLAVGSGMAASTVLGVAAIRRGDVARHQAWMTRAYALALGAGTQVLTGVFGDALLGTSVLAGDLTMGAGWAINLAVAEYAIRRGQRRTGRGANRRAPRSETAAVRSS
ncbi:MAG TPA: DUF2306 domain-containing protein [Propionibacteriaceae bacterium]|nr:DUF2306 domain-containing protein [Propionibacteriaceae bacterium]